MSKIVALIPARSGSKGVPGKNIKPLAGFPLIAYSIKAALKSKLIDRVIVSTDSEEYANIAREYGAEVPFLRPSELSGDKAADTDFFKHAIDWFIENEGEVPEYFAHLRPTTPLREPNVIDAALKSFIGSDFTALRSVHKMTESSYKSFEIEDGKLKCLCGGNFDIESANLARQAYPSTYDANGYIDVVRSEMVIQKNLIHSDRVQAYVTDVSYEIDELSDIDFLEYLINKSPTLVKRLF
ncbi:acylneuraminate cytidylyltransferase family protein [bacterium]|jgi:CMP-N,N'-diacetyllegionaminic acid synthase|nr:acylneuraminate cytidylyltransferase family protein [bacterium]